MSEEIKVAVLEQRLIEFGNVLERLDSAITKFSEVNSNITKMLAVHDEKIEQCNRSDSLMLKLIENIKDENAEDIKKSNERIVLLEKEIEEVSKIKWMTVGCGVVLAILTASISSLASGMWTPSGVQDQDAANQILRDQIKD
jgi:cytochrome c-type biogenesis protein CcmH/NrfG